MKKRISVIFILFLISSFLYSVDENILKNYDNYKIIKNFFSPRDEGSIKEKLLIKYIENFFEKNEIEYKIKKIDNGKDIVTNSFNIQAEIKGNGKNKERLIIICPLNTTVINQENYDNSISIQVMLDLILLCKNIQFKKDLIFLFSGANQDDDTNFYGIRYFIQNASNLDKSFVTIINIFDNKASINFSGSINKKPIAYTILKNFFLLNKENNYNIYFNKNEIYRSKFSMLSENNCLLLFLKNDVNAVIFSNKEKIVKVKTLFDSKFQKKLTDFFYAWLIRFDDINFNKDNDYHYIPFNLFGFNILFSESIQIIILLILILLLIVTRIFFPNLQRFHSKLLLKIFPYHLIIFIIYFISTFIPLLLFIFTGLITGYLKAYSNLTILYFINIFFIPLFIIYIFFELLQKLPFPKHSYLYIYGAFIFSVINFMIFFIIDISISYIYLWTSVLITLSQFTGKNIKLKYFFYSLSVIPILILLFDLLFLNNIQISSSINIILINIIFSILSFPFVLILLRIMTINLRRYKKKISKKKFTLIILSIMLISFFILILFSYLKNSNINKIDAILKSDQTQNISFLSIDSNNRIGNIYIITKEEENKYNFTKANAKIYINPYPLPYKIELKKNESDNLNLSFKISSNTEIEYLNIYLITDIDNDPLISNYNYIKANDINLKNDDKKQEVYKFLIGRNPGKDITFDLSLIKGNYKIYFELQYPDIDNSVINIIKKDSIINKKSIYSEEFSIE